MILKNHCGNTYDTSLWTSGWARPLLPPCASPLLTARPSGITWPRSSTDGLRTCWAGMSSPWGALYRRWSTLSPAAGTRPRQRQRPRHRWRLHGKRTKRRPQWPLPLKTGARPQRPLHPKRTSLKTAGRRRRHDGTSGVGSHRTLARLNPSLASAPGQPPRRRGHRRRPRRRSPVPASATTARALATRHAAVPTRRSAPSAAARTLVSTAFPNVRTASRLHTTATSAWKKVTAADRGSVRTAHDLHRRPNPPHPRTLKTPWTSLPPPATPPPRQTSLSSPTSRHSSRIPETTTTSGNGSGSRTQTPWPSTYSPPTLSAKYRSSSPSSTPRLSSCKPWRTWTPSTSVLQTSAEAANTSTGSPPGVSTPSTPACWRPTTTSAPPGGNIPSPSQWSSSPSCRRGRAIRWPTGAAPATRRSTARAPPACLRTPTTPSQDELSAWYEPSFLLVSMFGYEIDPLPFSSLHPHG